MKVQRTIVLVGPVGRTSRYPGCVVRPSEVFVLNVDMSTQEQRDAFKAAVEEVTCLRELGYEPWKHGDMQVVQFDSARDYGTAVLDVRFELACHYN